MCGIFGVVGHYDEAMANVCLDRLAHRGPDGRGVWMENNVFLGHRRLAVVDTGVSGQQPMHFSERFHIVFNGEIYNFIEIKKILIQHGIHFTTTSDTEVILAAFSVWGEACVEKFNGMWAFAIWDSLLQKLFLSRDRFGVKPLYYTQTKDTFIFASEMKSLIPFLKAPKINRSLVSSALINPHYENSETCLIESIYRFPAGTNGYLIPNRNLVLNPYWNTLDHLVTVPQKYEDQVSQFYELLKDAVKIRMRSDVPMGTALSGGVDSSAISALMHQLGRQNISGHTFSNLQNAFVSSFPNTIQDESVYAKSVADHLKITLNVIEIEEKTLIKDIIQSYYTVEEIYPGVYAPFLETYRQMKRTGISVSIDGHGADEIFGGYGFDLHHHLWDAGLKDSLSLHRTLKDMSPDLELFPVQSAISMIGIYKLKKLVKKLIGRGIVADMPINHPVWESLPALTRILFRSIHKSPLPTLLRNYDRFSMASGIEIRMPFMDYRVICFGLSLPPTSLFHEARTKSIIRDAVNRLLPPAIMARKHKIGWNAPMAEWINGPLKPFIMDTVHSKEFKNSELIYAPKVQEIAMEFFKKDTPTFSEGMFLWGQLQPFLWEEGFFNVARKSPLTGL